MAQLLLTLSILLMIKISNLRTSISNQADQELSVFDEMRGIQTIFDKLRVVSVGRRETTTGSLVLMLLKHMAELNADERTISRLLILRIIAILLGLHQILIALMTRIQGLEQQTTTSFKD
jgi:hypothetical protein